MLNRTGSSTEPGKDRLWYILLFFDSVTPSLSYTYTDSIFLRLQYMLIRCSYWCGLLFTTPSRVENKVLKHHWAARERCLLKKTRFAKEECIATSDRDLWGSLFHLCFAIRLIFQNMHCSEDHYERWGRKVRKASGIYCSAVDTASYLVKRRVYCTCSKYIFQLSGSFI